MTRKPLIPNRERLTPDDVLKVRDGQQRCVADRPAADLPIPEDRRSNHAQHNADHERCSCQLHFPIPSSSVVLTYAQTKLAGGTARSLASERACSNKDRSHEHTDHWVDGSYHLGHLQSCTFT